MSEFTASLPMVENFTPTDLIGDSTQTALQSGVVNGVKHELESTINAYKDRFGIFNTVFCGGDADFFESQLKAYIFVRKEIVMVGLNRILTATHSKQNHLAKGNLALLPILTSRQIMRYLKAFSATAFFLLATQIVFAQLGVAPNSRLGLGEIMDKGNIRNIGMGGVGVSNGSPFYANVMNPALLVHNSFVVFGANYLGERKTVEVGDQSY